MYHCYRKIFGAHVWTHTGLCVLLWRPGQAPFPSPLSHQGPQHLCLNSITSCKTSSVSTSPKQLLFLLLFEIAVFTLILESVTDNLWDGLLISHALRNRPVSRTAAGAAQERNRVVRLRQKQIKVQCASFCGQKGGRDKEKNLNLTETRGFWRLTGG